MLRVAILSSGLGHVSRGIEIWSANLAKLIDKNGINVTLFKGGGEKKHHYEKVIPCIRMNSKLWGKNSRISWGWRYTIQQYSFTVLSILFLRNYTIIQTSDYAVGKLLYKAKKYRLVKGEILFTDGNIFNLELLRNFKYVHETSNYYVEKAKELDIDVRNWFVIPHFVDTDIFKPSDTNIRNLLSIPENSFVILSAGAVGDEIKRMKWLIDEISLLQTSNPDREIYLLIAGSKESNANDIIEYGKKILLGRIHFLFNVPHDEMPKIYNTADVFVLCSLVERFGLVFIEAMACGIPAIGHVFPVTKYIIGDGGDCVDMARRGELAYALTKYLDIKYHFSKHTNSIKMVKTNFSGDVVFDEFQKMYKIINSL